MEYLGGKLAGLCDMDAAALEEQLNLGRGISGPRVGLWTATFKRILTTFEAPISHLTEPVRPKIAVCPNFSSWASLML